MMERTLKIFISCALGASIGTMVALQINGFFWWLGLLAGGLVGYLSYEFKAVIAAVQQSWHEVIGWRPSKTSQEIFVFGILMGVAVALTMILPISGYFLLSGKNGLEPLILGVTLGLALGVMQCFLRLLEASMDDSGQKAREIVDAFKTLLKFGNPAVFWCYLVPKGLVWFLTKGCPLGGRLGGRFVKRIFILIHSEIRLLCGVDAMIGAGIGYFAGSVFIGAIAGGIIGVLNYKIISVRVLHLVPINGR